jgi:hypothetical protein
MAAIIQTPRLILREWTDDDAEPYLLHCNTQAVMEHIGGVRSSSDVKSEVADLISQQREVRPRLLGEPKGRARVYNDPSGMAFVSSGSEAQPLNLS